MIRKSLFSILAAVCLLLALGVGIASAQSSDEMDSMGMMDEMMYVSDTCAMLPASIMVSSSTMGVECQQVSGGGIGVPSILSAGVIDAVDVWGSMDISAEVCFSGFPVQSHSSMPPPRHACRCRPNTACATA